MTARREPDAGAAVVRWGGWEIRLDNEWGGRDRGVASRGLRRLQLWNPRTRTSVRTPSRFTGGRFEIRRDGIRIVVSRWAEVAEHLNDLVLPGGVELAVLHMWMIVWSGYSVMSRPFPRTDRPAAAS